MNKVILAMLLVLIALLLLLAILMVGYSLNWRLWVEATSTPTIDSAILTYTVEFATYQAQHMETPPHRTPQPTWTSRVIGEPVLTPVYRPTLRFTPTPTH